MHALAHRLNLLGDALLPTLARLVFGGVLLVYFWRSALTKTGDGLFGLFQPGVGGYGQIWPRAMAEVGFNPDAMNWFHWAVVVAGTAAEFILPALIVAGLLTRLAALGMTGFVIVQSLTDIVGHGVEGATIGTWFDAASNALIVDQRAFWMLGFAVLLFKGAGPLSLDRLLFTGRTAP